MAEQKNPAQAEAAGVESGAPQSKARTLWLAGGAVAVLSLAFMAALMAVPGRTRVRKLEGPFVARLSQSDIQVNLAGEGSKRYLVMSLQAEYSAYDESYVTSRVGAGVVMGLGAAASTGEDPHYAAMLKDAMLRVASTKTRDQVTDPLLVAVFLDEVRAAADSVLFPVCVGDSQSPRSEDSRSGLKLGESGLESTMRGLLHEHVLQIDAPGGTIALDGGPAVSFRGTERDLRVADSAGQCVFLDVTRLDPGLLGEVNVGVAGRVRRIFRDSFLVQ